MNKEIIYVEDKAIVVDQDGNKKQVDNYDGLDKLLVQENIVESIENDIELAKKRLNQLPTTIDWRFVLSPVVFAVSGLIISYFLLRNDFDQILLPAMKIAGTILIPVFSLVSLGLYKDEKHDLRIRNGCQLELDTLEKQLCNEKEKLEELNKQKELADGTTVKQSFKVVSVNHKEELEKLKDELILSYNCGYYEKKYAKYYQNGTLQKKLSEQYNEEQIQHIKEYLEEKGYQKVLK